MTADDDIKKGLAMADLAVSTIYPGVLGDLNEALAILAAEVRRLRPELAEVGDVDGG